jgi:putative component of membrane protein insertase Oxa1/YidC/SpoIIIJ protein YidD
MLIRGYQRFISPRKGFHCAYRVHTGCASCSTLGFRAIRRHGVTMGLHLLMRRFERCAEAKRQLQVLVRRPRPQAGFLDALDCLSCGDCDCNPFDVLDCLNCGNGLIRKKRGDGEPAARLPRMRRSHASTPIEAPPVHVPRPEPPEREQAGSEGSQSE